MTNRDYLFSLSNEKLSHMIVPDDEICNFENCDGGCSKCVQEWLRKEYATKKVEQGQIRRKESGGYYLDYLVLYTKDDNCIILGESGKLFKISTKYVETWRVIDSENEDTFLKKVFNKL